VSCPRKFKYTYVDKIRGPLDNEALLKGSAIHSSLEQYPLPGTHKLSGKYQDIVDNFVNSKYSELFKVPYKKEESFGLSHGLEPIKYSNDALFRGYIDYYTVLGSENHYIRIVDYKTGKYKEPRFQNFNQLMFYAIYMFQKYQKINTIEIIYVYVEHLCDNSMVLSREYLGEYKKTLSEHISMVENSNFCKNATPLCNYCDFKTICDSDL